MLSLLFVRGSISLMRLLLGVPWDSHRAWLIPAAGKLHVGAGAFSQDFETVAVPGLPLPSLRNSLGNPQQTPQQVIGLVLGSCAAC